MIGYNLKIAFRNFNRHRKLSLLNLFGMTVGMTVAILIFNYVLFEKSYDNFNDDNELLFRIISIHKNPYGTEYSATTPLPMPATVEQVVKYVETVTGYTQILWENDLVKANGNICFNLTGFATDTNFLRLFNFPLISGNKESVLSHPSSVLLTEQTAMKLFGTDNPVGGTLSIGDDLYTVEGILSDLPENSIFRFDFLVSSQILNRQYPDLLTRWWHGGSMTFIKLIPGHDIEMVRADLARIPEKFFPDFLKERQEFDIQPLSSVHLDNRVAGDAIPAVSETYLYLLLVIGFSVLLIACVNFVNLSISQSQQRAKETGVRKISGAGRRQLVGMFVGETVINSVMAAMLAALLSNFFMPWFNELTQRNLAIQLTDGKTVVAIFLFGILTGVLSGIYPALVFSRYRPVRAFNMRSGIREGKGSMWKSFIVVQFVIAILLIVSQLFIIRQVSFMKTHDLGFVSEGLITIPVGQLPEEQRLASVRLLTEAIEKAGSAFNIKGISVTENVPGKNFPNKFAVIPERENDDTSKEMVVTSVDGNYASVFMIPIVSGRMLSDNIPGDIYGSVMLNEAAVRIFGWDDYEGKQIRFRHERDPLIVVGVLKDINFKSLHNSVEPVVYRYAGQSWLTSYMTIRADISRYRETLEFLEVTWKEIVPDTQFSYSFISEMYNDKYKEEERLARTLGTFSFLAVLLSCLGLYAIIAFTSERRTKEIGIRKVNGAKVWEVMALLNLDFVKLVVLASIVAIPIAWFTMNRWLQSFAYKTELSWWIFALAGVIALGIALLTVSWQSWRAARRNPVEALRYE
jgi:putative ABC transport system permease protein